MVKIVPKSLKAEVTNKQLKRLADKEKSFK